MVQNSSIVAVMLVNFRQIPIIIYSDVIFSGISYPFQENELRIITKHKKRFQF